MRRMRKLLRNIREQRNMSCALDRLCQLSLMSSANARHSAGQNFRALRQEAAQLRSILVINMLNLIHAEGANFSALAAFHISIHTG